MRQRGLSTFLSCTRIVRELGVADSHYLAAEERQLRALFVVIRVADVASRKLPLISRTLTFGKEAVAMGENLRQRSNSKQFLDAAI